MEKQNIEKEEEKNTNKNKYYYDEPKVWTKRKPKIKTEEQIKEELLENQRQKKNNIIKNCYYNYSINNIYTSKNCRRN